MGVIKRKPAVTFVPAEPSAAERMPRLIDREVIISKFDDLVLWASRQGMPRVVDQVLDERNKIRAARPAAVPVIPGRSS